MHQRQHDHAAGRVWAQPIPAHLAVGQGGPAVQGGAHSLVGHDGLVVEQTALADAAQHADLGGAHLEHSVGQGADDLLVDAGAHGLAPPVVKLDGDLWRQGGQR